MHPFTQKVKEFTLQTKKSPHGTHVTLVNDLRSVKNRDSNSFTAIIDDFFEKKVVKFEY